MFNVCISECVREKVLKICVGIRKYEASEELDPLRVGMNSELKKRENSGIWD